jgi:hypothetical protein
MHIDKLLHKLFMPTAQNIDKRLHRTLLQGALTLCDCRHLSIAGLGRSLVSSTAVKHVIKRIDRLFGNQRLEAKRGGYYQMMVNILVGSNPHPVILIDWSGLTRCGEYHFLRASVPVGGRALVIWESTYHERDYMKQKTHRSFIQALKALLPEGCRPIIITDAGFRCPWFKLISKQGWDFVGRVRNTTQCLETGETDWIPVKTYYTKATGTERYLFSGLLAKANPVAGNFYLFRGKKQHRIRKNLRGKRIQSSVSLKHAKRENEPWMIISSLSIECYTPKQVISLYKKRMQIEEAFRDLKNTRNGFSLRHCRSFNAQRLNVALLIGAIAMLLLWIVGLVAKKKEEDRLFQANTLRKRNVLSVFTIGWQYLKRKQQFYVNDFFDAVENIKLIAQNNEVFG